ncbi:MAG TPA: hypothetical protein VFI44_04875 [Ornithinibacter sp.]|nr:hypothetical protein [Ornithinibacter sp.]
MSAGWVAASVRARAMTRRRLGRAEVMSLGASPSVEAAVTALALTTYGSRVRPGQTLPQAQRSVVETVAWNIRVLAGWTPREGVAVLRALIAPLEAANVRDHLLRLAGADPPEPFRLGGLTTAWARLQRTTSLADVRSTLAASLWGDPGGVTPREIDLAMRTTVADRVVAAVPAAGGWAAGATALLVAREVFLGGGELPPAAHLAASRVVGVGAASAGTLADYRAALPTSARWALTDVEDPTDLWRAEARWWARVDRDAGSLVRRTRTGSDVVVGAVAMMAVDAWRVCGALELAARGGGLPEVVDAVA